MARTIAVATGAALVAARKSGVVLRNFIWINARTSGGTDIGFGFWDDIENVSVAVIDAETGVSTARTFSGGGSVIEVPAIPLVVGLDFQNISIKLNPLHDQVATMLRANITRARRIDIYRGVFSADTQLVTAAPVARFAGKIDKVDIKTARLGGASVAVVTAAPFRRELTRPNPSKKSNAFQEARSGDVWRKYEGKKMPVTWGEFQEKEEPQGLFGWGNFLGFL